jgi:hypothetical protein
VEATNQLEGPHWTTLLLTFAAGEGNLETLKWLHGVGCIPVSHVMARTATQEHRWGCLRWLMEEGGPEVWDQEIEEMACYADNGLRQFMLAFKEKVPVVPLSVEFPSEMKEARKKLKFLYKLFLCEIEIEIGLRIDNWNLFIHKIYYSYYSTCPSPTKIFYGRHCLGPTKAT